MWAFTEHGFYSVVADRDQPDTVLWVRARSETDIDRFVDTVGIGTNRRYKTTHLPTADYPYRIRVPKYLWTKFLTATVAEIDYPNYKNRVALHDKDRARLYGEVWGVMARGLECGWYRSVSDLERDFPPTPESTRIERLWWTECALEDYVHDYDPGASPEEAATDLIGDLLTNARNAGCDPVAILEAVRRHLEAEERHEYPDTIA